MSAAIEYLVNTASAAQIAEHLVRCDADFVPPLSSRVTIGDYAGKLSRQATRFEAWSAGTLIGLVAAYCNDRDTRMAYISSVSVLKEWMGKGVSARLLEQCLRHAEESDMLQISLQVAAGNTAAIGLYEKCGFAVGEVHGAFIGMTRQFRH